MRVDPIVGEKLWFRPKRALGWGWEPASWEGWLVTALFVGGIVALPFVFELSETATVGWSAVGVVVLLVICWLKGTSPGGPKASAEFERRTPPSGGMPGVRADDPAMGDAARNIRRVNRGRPPR